MLMDQSALEFMAVSSDALKHLFQPPSTICISPPALALSPVTYVSGHLAVLNCELAPLLASL